MSPTVLTSNTNLVVKGDMPSVTQHDGLQSSPYCRNVELYPPPPPYQMRHHDSFFFSLSLSDALVSVLSVLTRRIIPTTITKRLISFPQGVQAHYSIPPATSPNKWPFPIMRGKVSEPKHSPISLSTNGLSSSRIFCFVSRPQRRQLYLFSQQQQQRRRR